MSAAQYAALALKCARLAATAGTHADMLRWWAESDRYDQQADPNHQTQEN